MMSSQPIDPASSSDPVSGSDWSRTPAAMVCAAVLGVASLWGLVWSINHRPAPTESVALATAASTPYQAAPARLLIDLNNADLRQLQLLPGIGPKTAQRIIDDRTEHGPYETLKDLDRVRGIGPKTIAKVSEWVTISPEPQKPIAQSDSEP